LFEHYSIAAYLNCGLEEPPQYNVTGNQKPGTVITWGSKYKEDFYHTPFCCETRQEIMWSWDRWNPNDAFYPFQNRAFVWYDDHLPSGAIYGVRTGSFSSIVEDVNEYKGNRYYGWDRPGYGADPVPPGSLPLQLVFRPYVYDRCNEKRIFTGNEINFIFSGEQQ
jgi:hypothetical protein